jgi:hypothetical protein
MSAEQFQNLRKFTDLINYGSEKAIWKLTGCRAHCEKQEYSLKVVESLTLHNRAKNNKESNYYSFFHLSFIVFKKQLIGIPY